MSWQETTSVVKAQPSGRQLAVPCMSQQLGNEVYRKARQGKQVNYTCIYLRVGVSSVPKVCTLVLFIFSMEV